MEQTFFMICMFLGVGSAVMIGLTLLAIVMGKIDV